MTTGKIERVTKLTFNPFIYLFIVEADKRQMGLWDFEELNHFMSHAQHRTLLSFSPLFKFRNSARKQMPPPRLKPTQANRED